MFYAQKFAISSTLHHGCARRLTLSVSVVCGSRSRRYMTKRPALFSALYGSYRSTSAPFMVFAKPSDIVFALRICLVPSFNPPRSL